MKLSTAEFGDMVSEFSLAIELVVDGDHLVSVGISLLLQVLDILLDGFDSVAEWIHDF